MRRVSAVTSSVLLAVACGRIGFEDVATSSARRDGGNSLVSNSGGAPGDASQGGTSGGGACVACGGVGALGGTGTTSASGGTRSSGGTNSGGGGATRDARAPETGGTRAEASVPDATPASKCGNGVLDPSEICDDGNTSDGDYCSADCTRVTGRCGDSVVQNNEQCDDGNTTNGDGCNATCQYEWWNASFTRRVRITLDGSSLTAAVQDVPVGIFLDSTRFDYAAEGRGGRSVRFIDQDETTELSFEIEQWNTLGVSSVWVRVPALSKGVKHVLWLYYDNAVALDGQGVNATWDSNFRAVYHLSGGSADSTSHANAGTETGVLSAAGKIALGRSFDGNASHSVIGNPADLTDLFKGGGTVEAWINPAGWGKNSFGRVLDKSDDVNGGGGWVLQVHGKGTNLNNVLFQRGFDTAFGGWETPVNSVTLNQWEYVVVSYDDGAATNQPTLYLNGVPQTVLLMQAAAGTASTDAAQPLWIGDYSGDQSRTFDGTLDELRLSKTVRSANWVAWQYLSMIDKVATFAPEERLTP